MGRTFVERSLTRDIATSIFSRHAQEQRRLRSALYADGLQDHTKAMLARIYPLTLESSLETGSLVANGAKRANEPCTAWVGARGDSCPPPVPLFTLGGRHITSEVIVFVCISVSQGILHHTGSIPTELEQ